MTDEQILQAMQAMLEPVKEEIQQTRGLVEHQDHNISLIAEQYSDIARKLERVREIDELRDRIRTLERVIASHTDQIREIKKTQQI